MKVTVQVIVEGDGCNPVVRDVFTLERRSLGPGTVGLALDEAKGVLAAMQEVLVDEQVKAALAEQISCPHCGTARRHKDARTIVLRTLFGTLRLASPRWQQCPCRPQATRTFSPLASLLPERTTPELVYLETKFAGLVSYGLSAKLLGEVLPLGRQLHATAVRHHAQAVAERLDDELDPEQSSFVEGYPATWEKLPRPDLPLTVSLDGGYVHSATQTSRRDGWFEVIAGTSRSVDGPTKSFGFVQTYDTKPKRRLFEVLCSQGMQANQQVTFVTDGADDVRDLPQFLNPQAEHLLDWFHVTMRLTVMTQMAKGLRATPTGADRSVAEDPSTSVAHELERLKWFLWHGNLFRALQTMEDVEFDLEAEDASPEQRKLLQAVREFGGYIRANAGSIPNYGELYRAGEVISSALAESTINQVVSKRMVKKQQMRWTPRGAHLLLQVRTRVLNEELADDFHRWYPGFTHRSEPQGLTA
jgi:hypothetical protein